MVSPITITELWYYPIKSCKGWRVDTATFDAKGIVGDRRFMVVRADGRFLTQREFPAMALIQPMLTPNGLTLEAPQMEDLGIATTDAADGDHEAFEATIWNDTVRVVSQGREAAEWLTEYLKTPCRLVSMERDFTRITDQTYSLRSTDQTVFADGYATLLTSEDSLHDLNTRLVTPDAQPVPMTRFRPNIVITGASAWKEDHWRVLRIGKAAASHDGGSGMVFEAVKPCGRCIMTTIDQNTAQKGVEPLPTLKQFRRSHDGAKVLFGQNLTHERGGTLHVGDVVEILE